MHHPKNLEHEDLTGLPQVGDVLDEKYRIDGVLGVGGMGVVFAATHLRLDERVAIKILLPQWSEDRSLVQRFMQEARACTKIRSEHVVRVLDVGLLGEQPYLVLEFLEGKDFDAVVAECGPLQISDAVDCLLQASEALAEAHASGIVHRDLKPANLFLTHRADGSPCVKLLDFGISKVIADEAPRLSGFQTQGTLPNMVMGSPHYMAPEQMQSSRDADARSDVWSLGAILHELVTGAPPFEADTITALCASILRDSPPPLTRLRADVTPPLERVVLRCLEKNPADRFQNVADLALAVAEFGSASARASARTISRIVYGGFDTHDEDRATPSSSTSSRSKPSAAEILGSLPPTPMRSRVPGVLLAAAAALAVGGGIGWSVVRQTIAVHQTESRLAPAETPPPSRPEPEAVSPPAVTSPAVSQIRTTSALASAARTASAPPAAMPQIAPSRPRPVSTRPRHAKVPRPSAPARDDVDDPYGQPDALPAPALVTSPVPSAAVTAPVAVPEDPNALFEGRK
jgi:serine/threonine-protein kinase